MLFLMQDLSSHLAQQHFDIDFCKQMNKTPGMVKLGALLACSPKSLDLERISIKPDIVKDTIIIVAPCR